MYLPALACLKVTIALGGGPHSTVQTRSQESASLMVILSDPEPLSPVAQTAGGVP